VRLTIGAPHSGHDGALMLCCIVSAVRTTPSPRDSSVGRRHGGKRVLVLVRVLDVRVLTEQGGLIRELVLDPNRDYQPLRKV